MPQTQITVDLPDNLNINELDLLMMQISYYEGLMLGINIPLKHEPTPQPQIALVGDHGSVTMVLDVTHAETGETEQITLTDGVLSPTTDNDIDLGIGGSKEFKDIHAKTVRAKHYAADDTAPVADGTYTMGLGGTTNGTITVKDGIITAIQEAVA